MRKIDPLTVEGSEERARDRGDPGLIQIPDPEGNSLAVPSVVQRILWEHIADLVALRRRWLRDEIDKVQALGELKAMGERRQAILYGQAEGYEATTFNSAEKLGVHLATNVVGGEPADAAARAFNQVFIDMAGDMEAHEQGKLSTEMFQAVIEDVVLRYTGHFLGVPPEVFAGESS